MAALSVAHLLEKFHHCLGKSNAATKTHALTEAVFVWVLSIANWRSRAEADAVHRLARLKFD